MMYQYPLLTENNIFAIPAGDYFGQPPEHYFLVYAPFSDNALIVTPGYLSEMEKYLSARDGSASSEIRELMDKLLAFDPEKQAPRITNPDDFARLAILPNNICNFHCNYCYSALGRSNKVIDQAVIQKALDHFIDPGRIQNRMLFIAILGGGEPLLSWDLVRYTLEYSKALADRHGFGLDLSLVTNGSVMTDEMLRILKKYDVTTSFSFEILEEVQDLQRGHYKLVDSNIQKFIAYGMTPRLRSTITGENVKLQEMMVREVIERYPAVKDIMMEAVTDAGSFSSIEDVRKFFRDYLDHFFAAWKLGLAQGKNVECSASRNFSLLIDRFCPGEFAITPEGEISMCTRITSARDPGYADSIYGRITGDLDIEIDYERFAILADDNVQSREKCFACHAKWHCGGGCMAHRYVYPPEVLEVICDYTREFMRRMILEKMDREYVDNDGVSLREAVLQNDPET